MLRYCLSLLFNTFHRGTAAGTGWFTSSLTRPFSPALAPRPRFCRSTSAPSSASVRPLSSRSGLFYFEDTILNLCDMDLVEAESMCFWHVVHVRPLLLCHVPGFFCMGFPWLILTAELATKANGCEDPRSPTSPSNMLCYLDSCRLIRDCGIFFRTAGPGTSTAGTSTGRESKHRAGGWSSDSEPLSDLVDCREDKRAAPDEANGRAGANLGLFCGRRSAPGTSF